MKWACNEFLHPWTSKMSIDMVRCIVQSRTSSRSLPFPYLPLLIVSSTQITIWDCNFQVLSWLSARSPSLNNNSQPVAESNGGLQVFLFTLIYDPSHMAGNSFFISVHVNPISVIIMNTLISETISFTCHNFSAWNDHLIRKFILADDLHLLIGSIERSYHQVTGVGCNSIEGVLDCRELVLPPNLLHGEESRYVGHRIVRGGTYVQYR